MHPSLLLLLPLAALAVVSSSGGAPASPDRGRYVYRQVQVGGVSCKYAVRLPPGHDPKQKWPAVLFLHGSGESGTDGEAPTRVGFGPALQAHPERWPFVVVFPQKPSDEEEWEERENIAFAALEDATKAYAIDTKRVALAGMSQGGHGTWFIGARHPERWRCLVPVCGYGRPRCISGRIAALPVWAFHGLRDDVVDPIETQRTIALTREIRSQRGIAPETARMTLFPEANHNAWDPAFAHDSLNVWLREQLEVR